MSRVTRRNNLRLNIEGDKSVETVYTFAVLEVD